MKFASAKTQKRAFEESGLETAAPGPAPAVSRHGEEKAAIGELRLTRLPPRKVPLSPKAAYGRSLPEFRP